jgi:DNA-binding CsgD family transcriptional regulator
MISPKTVSHHIAHIYAKIDASSQVQASLFAMRQGLLPEEQIAARGGPRP